MVEYKCAICKTPLAEDTAVVGVVCRVCGGKVFYKKRPATKKTLKAE